jgi:hypothetical protein
MHCLYALQHGFTLESLYDAYASSLTNTKLEDTNCTTMNMFDQLPCISLVPTVLGWLARNALGFEVPEPATTWFTLPLQNHSSRSPDVELFQMTGSLRKATQGSSV